jgi:hypothetical protein
MINKFNFYYDESEHSRKINNQTIQQENYYDNFITSIVGWKKEKNKELEEKYIDFEDKYDERKSKGELKSTTIKPKQLKYGFSSLSKDNVEFINDFFDLFNEEIYVYFSVTSKIEYIILQLFRNYENSMFINTDSMKYSIVKAIVLYRPKEIINGMYDSTSELVELLKIFFEERIEENKQNHKLKKMETQAFKEHILLLESISEDFKIDWEYRIAFDGFSHYLKELKIKEYSLFLDMEGVGTTSVAAHQVGLTNVLEIDSKESVGVRWADMLAGLISKFLKSFHQDLRYSSISDGRNKKILSINWFKMTEQQLLLYKKFHYIISCLNNNWYKSFSGLYADDLLTFVSFLEFVSEYESIEEIQKDIEMIPEYFNTKVCKRLEEYFNSMQSSYHFKLPITLVSKSDLRKEYIVGKHGQKIYYDESKQPLLNISIKPRKYYVLSAGVTKKSTPIVTIKEHNEVYCYKLPSEYSEWVLDLISLSGAGIKVFPTMVEFGLKKEKYYAEID